ncbi:MAG: hypothetical protein II926_07710 [Bacteroidales bacterium]|nr:hypothetical protein [Bacteroidales bacterium]
MNNIQELITKLVLLSNPRTHDATDAVLKGNTVVNVSDILNHRSLCVNVKFLVSTDLLLCNSLDEKKQILSICDKEIEACDMSLRQIRHETIVDWCLAQITQK